MKQKMTLKILALLLCLQSAAQTPNEKWYHNPLGFEPIKLHTSTGFILSALAVGGCMLATNRKNGTTGSISIYNDLGLSFGYHYPETVLYHNAAGLNYRLRDFLSVGLEVDICSAMDDYNRTTGVALRPFARFYAVCRPQWKLYFESGGGLICFSDKFPAPTPEDERMGTKLNGITKYGVATEIQVLKAASLRLGIRHTHISNGNSKGIERNPSHDSNGFFIGISFRPSLKFNPKTKIN